jgi:hypothetical protein
MDASSKEDGHGRKRSLFGRDDPVFLAQSPRCNETGRDADPPTTPGLCSSSRKRCGSKSECMLTSQVRVARSWTLSGSKTRLVILRVHGFHPWLLKGTSPSGKGSWLPAILTSAGGSDFPFGGGNRANTRDIGHCGRGLPLRGREVEFFNLYRRYL